LKSGQGAQKGALANAVGTHKTSELPCMQGSIKLG